MPTHQEILKKEHTRADHAADLLSICDCIVAIGREVIVEGEFEKETS